MAQVYTPTTINLSHLYSCHYCCQCTKPWFQFESELEHHMRQLHQCDHCPALVFTALADLVIHLKTMHSNSSLSAINQSINGKEIDGSHKLLLSKSVETRGTLCSQCGKRCQSPFHLRRHLRTHTGEKPFKCEECSRNFSANDKLLRHLRKVHAREMPFKCEKCTDLRVFATQSLLDRHNFSMHPRRKNLPKTTSVNNNKDELEQRKDINVKQAQITIISNNQKETLQPANTEVLNPLVDAKAKSLVNNDKDDLEQGTNIYANNQAQVKTISLDNQNKTHQPDKIKVLNFLVDTEAESLLNKDKDKLELYANQAQIKRIFLDNQKETHQSATIEVMNFLVDAEGESLVNKDEDDRQQRTDIQAQFKRISLDNQNKTHQPANTKVLNSLVDADAESLKIAVLPDSQLNHHDQVENDPLRCSHCDRRFQSPYHVKRHILTHTGEKPFKCDKCSKRFSLKSNLVQHVRGVHDRVWQFKCPKCLVRFDTREKLESHISSQKCEILTEDVNSCEHCNKSFQSAHHLKVHLRSHTGQKPFCCGKCSKSFTTKGNLQAHISRVHDGIREFVCGECQAGFATKTELTRHGRLHTGEKPYQCPHCSICFRWKSSCQMHLQVVHQEQANLQSKLVVT